MKRNRIFISNGMSSTAKIAHGFAKSLNKNCIIYLNGEVGSGKTMFTRLVATYFGIHTITSSSFSRIQLHKGITNIIHCDLYRGNYGSMQYLEEIETHLIDPWLLLIEWPNEILSHLNCPQYTVNIEITGLNDRSICIDQIS